MRVGIALLRFFPHGGAQRDALFTAEACRQAGHDVVMYVWRWDGPRTEGIRVRLLEGGAWTNHGRMRRFAAALADARREDGIDVLLGFERLPGLDAWFAADPCYLARLQHARASLRALTPRARTLAAFERAVAGVDSATRILLLDPRQRAVFRALHGTADARMVDLPVGVAPDRLPGPVLEGARTGIRRALGVAADEQLLLLLGSDFRRKGLDRTLAAFAALSADVRSRTRLLAAGADAAGPWRSRARRLGVAARVRIEGGRDDVRELMQAADLLVHPARVENTGSVIVEALASGLPVLCTAACGYAAHVTAAGAGWVIAEPFEQHVLDQHLQALLTGDLAAQRARARAWARRTDLDGLHRRIVRELEAIVERRA
ncbi:MAG: glycosyltransferase family 4 protein [Pseudomonadales bacterium]|jgi:UDP-glucose:(heptosyl)LPS alpha-1,3-glucosyltransferase|nr:glycosyltransferase family 4 protein [Pseudomonadales bacterium]